MSSTEVLRSAEKLALSENQIISHVVGKNAKEAGGKMRSWSAGGFIMVILLILMGFMAAGNLIPVAASERLIEETDIQYADAVESKILVFQQALKTHTVPANTIQRLKDNGVEVVEGENGEQALVYNGRTITADNFVNAVKTDAGLYTAFNNATYSRAAYWYDEAAEKVFREIGTNRDNYTADADFNEVMSDLMGEGSDIDVNNVVAVARETEDGEIKIEYEGMGVNAESSVATDFVEAVRSKNTAASSATATLNAADTLNVADTMAKEKRSSIFFLAFMENISKMKAGQGNESKINEAMNYLYQEEDSEVVDITTGEVVSKRGSMVESPSLYAVLSGEKVNVEAVENYASDRVLKTVENKIGENATSEVFNGTISSTNNKSKVKGVIGRFVTSNEATASSDDLSGTVATVNNSLINNSFNDTKGIAAGELLVEGAVNVGKALARASGATTGDATAVKSYARLNNTILALDAEADRMNRSPFDITSKNTFLGSIVYKLAVISSKNTGILGVLRSFSTMAARSLGSLVGVVSAEDNENGYLSQFGECETLGTIGAVGSAACSSVMTFDTSTLNNTFSDAGFVNFIENNTILENGVRKIKSNSTLADFIKYNNERKTSDGVMDGGILQAINNGGGSIPFVSDIVAMIKTYLGASNNDKRVATGAAFVNSDTNSDWETYKYAQRYVSLARATEMLKSYDGDTTAYNTIYGFEGNENPVVAFLNEYYTIASY